MSKFQVIDTSLLSLIVMALALPIGLGLLSSWEDYRFFHSAGVSVPTPTATNAADFRLRMLEKNWVLNSADRRWYPPIQIQVSACSISGPRYSATLTCKYPLNPLGGIFDPAE
jgi:hypothetical protein